MAEDTARYPHLFAPLTRGRLRLRNRIIHASITTRHVIDCRVTASMIQYYANRARGGAAAVVSEPLNMARVQTAAHRVRVWNDDNVDGLQRWAAAVEEADCRLLGQVQDSGRGRHERGRNPAAIGAAALPDDLSWTVPRVLSGAEIRQMVEDFGHSAARLERCGFSGVEISGGHEARPVVLRELAGPQALRSPDACAFSPRRSRQSGRVANRASCSASSCRATTACPAASDPSSQLRLRQP